MEHFDGRGGRRVRMTSVAPPRLFTHTHAHILGLSKHRCAPVCVGCQRTGIVLLYLTWPALYD